MAWPKAGPTNSASPVAISFSLHKAAHRHRHEGCRNRSAMAAMIFEAKDSWSARGILFCGQAPMSSVAIRVWHTPAFRMIIPETWIRTLFLRKPLVLELPFREEEADVNLGLATTICGLRRRRRLVPVLCCLCRCDSLPFHFRGCFRCESLLLLELSLRSPWRQAERQGWSRQPATPRTGDAATRRDGELAATPVGRPWTPARAPAAPARDAEAGSAGELLSQAPSCHLGG